MAPRNLLAEVATATGQRGLSGPTIPEMNLTPEEKNLYQYHLANLRSLGTGGVRNPDGTVSTIYQAVVQGPDRRFYNIPTVWGGRILPVHDAVRNVAQAGWGRFPSYNSPDEADARYMQMHQYMERDN